MLIDFKSIAPNAFEQFGRIHQQRFACYIQPFASLNLRESTGRLHPDNIKVYPTICTRIYVAR